PLSSLPVKSQGAELDSTVNLILPSSNVPFIGALPPAFEPVPFTSLPDCCKSICPACSWDVPVTLSVQLHTPVSGALSCATAEPARASTATKLNTNFMPRSLEQI